jgi:putative transposase
MDLFENGEKHLSVYSLKKVLTLLKQTDEYLWFNEVSRQTLSLILLDLDDAYGKFFAIKPARFTKKMIAKATRTKKKLVPYDLEGHPKFKSKKDNDFKFPVRSDSTYFKGNSVNIEKIGKIQYQTNYDLPQGKVAVKISNPRIKFENNKWMLSFGMECEKQAPKLTDKSLGIDLGIKTLATASFGGEKITFHNINKSKRVRNLERKRKHVQRNISRKYRTNGSYEKTASIKWEEDKLRQINTRLSNIRKDYTHQTTHKFISLLPYRVVMEDLNVRGMMKNKHLAKSIQDCRWAEFIRQMRGERRRVRSSPEVLPEQQDVLLLREYQEGLEAQGPGVYVQQMRIGDGPRR